MLLQQRLELAPTLRQFRLQGLPLYQQCLPRFQSDDGVCDALAAAVEKAGLFFRIVIPHPPLEVQMPDGKVRRIPESLVVLRDAIAAVWELTVEDGIVDALGA